MYVKTRSCMVLNLKQKIFQQLISYCWIIYGKIFTVLKHKQSRKYRVQIVFTYTNILK